MKKTKLLPLLFIAPLLASCGLSKPKEPKFADAGKEVKAEKFVKDLEAAYKKNSFSKKGLIDSGVFKSEGISYVVTEATGTITSNSELLSSEKYDAQFDKDNKLFKSVDETQSELKSESSEYGKQETADHQKVTKMHEQLKVGKKNFFIEACEETKEYEKVAELDKAVTLESKLDELTKGFGDEIAGYLMSAIGTYSILSAKDQKQFKFFENGNVFTIEMGKVTQSYSDLDMESKPIYTMDVTTSGKLQADLSEGKMKYASWSETELVFEYKQDYYSNVKGDKTVTKTQISSTASYEAKKVSLKAPDLSGYVKLGLDW